jgi:hypothetical protein
MNLCANQVKRAGRGFANFDHYRLRVLLIAGRCHVAYDDPAATDRISCSPLKPEEPH